MEPHKIPTFKVAEGMLNTKTQIRRPEILSVEIDEVEQNLKLEKVNPNILVLITKAGIEIPIYYFLTFFQDELHNEKPDKIIQKKFEYEEAKLINTETKEATKIRGFTFTGRLTIINKDLEQQIEIVDEIWMIMKALFENNSFTISKMGMIKKEKNIKTDRTN